MPRLPSAPGRLIFHDVAGKSVLSSAVVVTPGCKPAGRAPSPAALGETVLHQQRRTAGAVVENIGLLHLVAALVGPVRIKLQHVGIVDGQLSATGGAARLHHFGVLDRDPEPERAARAGRIVLHAGAQYQHQPQRHQTGKVLFHIGFHFIPLNLYYLYRVSAALHPGPTAAIL